MTSRTTTVMTLAVAALLAAGTPPAFCETVGTASYYGKGFHGRRSADGERFNMNAMTAAHRSLPFGTRLQVTNLRNGKSVMVEVNDRGPHVRGRIVDLSKRAADVIGIGIDGVAPVKIEARVADQPTSDLKEKVASIAAARALRRPKRAETQKATDNDPP